MRPAWKKKASIMLKMSENPPLLWPEHESLTNFEGQWWVAHTKSRNEKALAWQMMRKEIQYFLPMTMKVSQNKGRTIRSLLPLFTGYVFFCGSENSRLDVLQTNRVANLIEVKNPKQLIDDLFPIEQVIRQGQNLSPHPYIQKGQKCRVIAGPLMGIEGIVVNDSNQTRLVLSVDILGQATSVEIDSDMLEVME